MIGRTNPAYARAHAPFNERFDGVKPLAVLRVAGAADVRQAILWARRHGIRIRARSGGHSYAGYSTVEDGLVLDLSAVDGIAVHKQAQSATVGAGALLIDVYARLAKAGGTIPAGSCPTVGVGGLALGGGIGFASRKLGTTADNVLALTIVTADGRLLTCDRSRHADLYWACRGGGGGNFGVVTSFRFRVHPVTQASYFVLTWPWASMSDAVAAWQRFAPRAPDGLFSVCRLATGTSQPTVQAFGQFFGSEAALVTLLKPLRDIPGASLTTGTSAYLDLMERWAGCKTLTFDECHPTPSGSLGRDRFAAKSDYVAKRLPAAGIATLAELAREATGARRRGGDPRFVRWSDQPRLAGRHGVRPPTRALLDPVLRVDRGRFRRRAGPRLAARFPVCDGPLHVRLRVPERHRRGTRRLGARVLRLELSAPPPGQVEIRPRQRLPLPAEHPPGTLRASQALGVSWLRAPID